MNNVLRQRLVGALVLLALAVVFWPIIFVDTEREEAVTMLPMPERPVIDTSPLPVPDNRSDAVSASLPAAPDIRAEQADADARTALAATVEASADATGDTDAGTDPDPALLPEARSLDPPAPRPAAPEAALVDEAGLGVAWVLQVATVSSATRAAELVARLQGRGYSAFVRETQQNDRQLFRVQIGPNVEQAKLESVKAAVDPWLGVDAKILRYLQ